MDPQNVKIVSFRQFFLSMGDTIQRSGWN